MKPPPPGLPRGEPRAASAGGPEREGAIARALRWARDRRRLAELDTRLLRDVGLTRGDAALGTPFAAPTGRDRTRGHSAPLDGVRRMGGLDARGWNLKLYAPSDDAAGLRPEDVAAARRAFRAALAEPRSAPALGFALLRRPRAGEAWTDPGALALSAYRWEGADLHRHALLLAGEGDAPRRAPDTPGRFGCTAEIGLLAQECVARREAVLEAAAPSLNAYLAECCA